MSKEAYIDPAHAVLWQSHPPEHDVISTRTLGFWLYLLSDSMIVSSLFASYLVLNHRVNAAAGSAAGMVVHPVVAFFETVLLCSGILAYGFALVGLKREIKTRSCRGLPAPSCSPWASLSSRGSISRGLRGTAWCPSAADFCRRFMRSCSIMARTSSLPFYGRR